MKNYYMITFDQYKKYKMNFYFYLTKNYVVLTEVNFGDGP